MVHVHSFFFFCFFQWVHTQLVFRAQFAQFAAKNITSTTAAHNFKMEVDSVVSMPYDWTFGFLPINMLQPHNLDIINIIATLTRLFHVHQFDSSIRAVCLTFAWNPPHKLEDESSIHQSLSQSLFIPRNSCAESPTILNQIFTPVFPPCLPSHFIYNSSRVATKTIAPLPHPHTANL